jgi:hypothetical protein
LAYNSSRCSWIAAATSSTWRMFSSHQVVILDDIIRFEDGRVWLEITRNDLIFSEMGLNQSLGSSEVVFSQVIDGQFQDVWSDGLLKSYIDDAGLWFQLIDQWISKVQVLIRSLCGKFTFQEISLPQAAARAEELKLWMSKFRRE